MLRTWVCKLSSHLWVPRYHLREVFRELVTFLQMLRLQVGQCSQQDVRRSVQRASLLESTFLHRFSKIVLNHASEHRCWLADHNVPKSNIILLTGYSASNPHHQHEPQPLETREHPGSHCSSRCRASHSG